MLYVTYQFAAVMFEEGVLLGAETDTSLLACDGTSQHQPLTVVERTVSSLWNLAVLLQ